MSEFQKEEVINESIVGSVSSGWSTSEFIRLHFSSITWVFTVSVYRNTWINRCNYFLYNIAQKYYTLSLKILRTCTSIVFGIIVYTFPFFIITSLLSTHAHFVLLGSRIRCFQSLQSVCLMCGWNKIIVNIKVNTVHGICHGTHAVGQTGPEQWLRIGSFVYLRHMVQPLSQVLGGDYYMCCLNKRIQSQSWVLTQFSTTPPAVTKAEYVFTFTFVFPVSSRH